ncbi:TonB-dependent receptor plug domain-containing protein [Paraflavitalea speifideaquila]|uniref:TonB-dependent receptor plug domain-containing protein n=1 Tax=Paraflavitalea speifideaquila TaxID=3076558 RepID=UPI0028E7361C|nr:TonB-dependent receptor plug domain-containing protein [Paraflavitalea speifideiaquila]
MRKILLHFLAMFITLYSFAQSKNINGRIVDERGEPIAFASVKVKGARTGVAADAAGKFTVRAAIGDVLVISSAGSAEKEVTVTDVPLINVQLTRSQGALTEVLVTGYTARSKRASAGSASVVGIDDVRTQPAASFDQLLQGQATGVNVRSGTGQPGAAAEIVIRGRGSITGSTAPLYVVDGVQINSADFATLNQGDFESITLLKDASAAAIYGSRGAGGVVVITTRRGRSGPVRFNYDVQYGQSKWPRQKLELMSTQEKLAYEMDRGNPNGWSKAERDSLKISIPIGKMFSFVRVLPRCIS